jgi:hypothetical protein
MRDAQESLASLVKQSLRVSSAPMMFWGKRRLLDA